MTTKIAMIAAVAANGVIGAQGTIPWRIPSDMAFFRATTMGKPLIMGRKQFESVGRPLRGRTNIVVTRQDGYQRDGMLVMASLDSAFERGRAIAAADGVGEVMVIGGGEIYAQAMPYADRLYISHVEARPEGDVLFPAIDEATWMVSAEPAVISKPEDEAVYRVRVYVRRAGRAALIPGEPVPI